MAIVLRSEVDVMGTFVGFFGRPAIMDLHDDGRFVLVRIDPRAGTFGETILDTSISNLRVSGTSTYLILKAGTVSKRVDFSGRSPLSVVGFGLVGYALQAHAAATSGINAWIEVFRFHGVMKRFSNTTRRVVIMLAIAGVLVVGAVVAAFVAGARG